MEVRKLLQKVVYSVRKMMRTSGPQAVYRNRTLRVYTLADDVVWYLSTVQKRSLEEVGKFYSCRYRIRLAIPIPYDGIFFRQAYEAGQTLHDLTGCIVNQNEVIEIDDGRKPVFFAFTADRIRRISFDKSSILTASALEVLKDNSRK